MSQMLTYPGFSVVFIQTFSVHHTKEFILPKGALDRKDKDLKADALGVPIVWVERDIENQIFVLPDSSPLKGQDNVRRYSLRGFDFTMPIVPASDEAIYEATLSGHCNVEMNLFFGHTVSITYRFLFDGEACRLSCPVTTDHIIVFLSTWLSAEFWSTDEGEDKTSIDYKAHLSIDAIWLDADGNPLDTPEAIRNLGTGRSFDAVALRYKSFIYRHCSRFKKDIPVGERQKNARRWKKTPFSVDNDLHYAMVDVWENIQHIEPDGTDLFSPDRPDRLTEAQIIDHIREEHKNELIGLLSLYPEEWPYRDPAAFDEVCGENIAIDTDDLVLAGSSLCVVIGTYGRRGAGEEGVNWEEHLKERAHYHVSWPEYLLILQMILAKKYVIGLATDTVVLSTLNAEKKSSQDLIGANASLSMRLTRMVTQLDVVKYSKFPSHKVMFDRTTARLGLSEDYERLGALMESVDNSLHNLSDYKSMRSEFLLNIILAIISVASTFELFFQEDEMPFLTYFGFESNRLSAIVVAVIACITIFALLLVVSNAIRNIWERIKSLINYED